MGLFDALDWNGDGKQDFFDDMIEFSIFQEVMNDDSDSNVGSDEDFEDDEDWQ